jgi:hypothetical protein
MDDLYSKPENDAREKLRSMGWVCDKSGLWWTSPDGKVWTERQALEHLNRGEAKP